jgi:hypothetical protein
MLGPTADMSNMYRDISPVINIARLGHIVGVDYYWLHLSQAICKTVILSHCKAL